MARSLNKEVFYDIVRESPFGGRLTPLNFEGTEAIINYWSEYRHARNIRCLAYILATVFHETGGSMDWRTHEVGKGRGHAYGKPAGKYGHVYYGRSWPQLTWITNYEKMTALLNNAGYKVDLVKSPNLITQDAKIAAFVLFEGMYKGDSGRGDFTGKSLDQHFSGDRLPKDEDEHAVAVKARNIVNGTDKAVKIANYYMTFLKALEKSYMPRALVPTSSESIDENIPPAVSKGEPITKTESFWGTVANWFGGLSMSGVFAGAGGFFQAIDSKWALLALLGCAAIMGVGGYFIIRGRLRIKHEAGV